MGGGSFRVWMKPSGRRWIFWGVLFLSVLSGGMYVRWRSNLLVARLSPDAERVRDTSQGVLVVAGGGMLPRSIKEQFWLLAGGPSARIVVIPASQMEPEQLKIYEEHWDEFETLSVSMLQADSRTEADRPEFSQSLETATGVWLGGGQQTWLTGWYRGTLVHERMKQLLARGGVIGGTSAGAAVMSDVMIAGGKRIPLESRGFGFLNDVIVDQHFLQRNRVTRLMKELEKYPDSMGLGIDERTALIVELKTGRLSVVGDSFVLACLLGSRDQPARFEILKSGDITHLDSLRNPDPIIESTWVLDSVLMGEE